MVREELIARSPLRILERSTHGGLGRGNLGVIASRRGVGKTACLVHIATDQLLRGGHVIHVSFAANTAHIVDWYENIFGEIARTSGLEQAMSVHDEIVRNRILMNFDQEGIRLSQVAGSLGSMIGEGHFAADCIIVDGYDLGQSSEEELREVRRFGAERGLEIWLSASLGYEQPRYDQRGYPLLLSPLMEEIGVLICLHPADRHILLRLVKDHDSPVSEELHLALDPKSLLIAQE
jgi:hypothetical protein